VQCTAHQPAAGHPLEKPVGTLASFCMTAFEVNPLLRRMAELLYTAAKRMRVVRSLSVHSNAVAVQT
jgi:hypothetical protein